MFILTLCWRVGFTKFWNNQNSKTSSLKRKVELGTSPNEISEKWLSNPMCIFTLVLSQTFLFFIVVFHLPANSEHDQCFTIAFVPILFHTILTSISTLVLAPLQCVFMQATRECLQVSFRCHHTPLHTYFTNPFLTCSRSQSSCNGSGVICSLTTMTFLGSGSTCSSTPASWAPLCPLNIRHAVTPGLLHMHFLYQEYCSFHIHMHLLPHILQGFFECHLPNEAFCDNPIEKQNPSACPICLS